MTAEGIKDSVSLLRGLGVTEARFDAEGNVLYVRLGPNPAAEGLESAKAKDEVDTDDLLYAAS